MEILKKNDENKKRLQHKILKYLKTKDLEWGVPDLFNYKMRVISFGENYDLSALKQIEDEMHGLASFKVFNNEVWVYLKILNEEREEEEIIKPFLNSFINSFFMSMAVAISTTIMFLLVGYLTMTSEHLEELKKKEVNIGYVMETYGFLRSYWLLLAHPLFQ